MKLRPGPEFLLNLGPRERLLAAKIARELGSLYRGPTENICREKGGAVDVFLEAAKAEIIKGILPHLWESTKGGYGVSVIGRGHRDILWFAPDFSRWRVEGVDKHGDRSGVVSLMSFIAYGREPGRNELLQLLGLAAARVMLGEAQK